MRRRLVTLALASTSLVAIAFLVPLFGVVSALATDRSVQPAELAARSLAPAAALVDEDTLEGLVAVAAADIGGAASVVLADDRVVGDPVELDAPIAAARSEQRAIELVDGDRWRLLVPVVVDEGVLVVDVRVVVDRTGVVVAWIVLALLGIGLVAGASLLADRLARRTVAAAGALEDTADRLSAGDLTARASVVDPPDLARVGRALDQLADRIGDLLDEEAERAADLSHGLRTPATALRLDAEALPDSPERARVLEDLTLLDDAISAVIDQARAPVRAGAGEGADLAGSVRARVAFWAGLAADEGRPMSLDVPDLPVVVPVTRQDLGTLLDVLLDNAFRHTPVGTPVSVAVRPSTASVSLVVEDDGPGLPDGVDVLARGRSGTTGSGLGLDIARRIVERAGGRFSLVDVPADDGRGRGVRASATFPVPSLTDA